MSVNINNKEQNSISLMNVSYYDSKADYIRLTFPGVESDEEAAEEFSDELESGFIQDITCGTYNGATDVFTPWRVTDNNILDTIHNNIMEVDFYSFVADYMCDDPEEAEKIIEWADADYIREFTEFYEVFIIGGRIYVNID